MYLPLPLLVPHRGGPRGAADAGPHEPAGFRGRPVGSAILGAALAECYHSQGGGWYTCTAGISRWPGLRQKCRQTQFWTMRLPGFPQSWLLVVLRRARVVPSLSWAISEATFRASRAIAYYVIYGGRASDEQPRDGKSLRVVVPQMLVEPAVGYGNLVSGGILPGVTYPPLNFDNLTLQASHESPPRSTSCSATVSILSRRVN